MAGTSRLDWRRATLGDWEDVPLKGREVVLCFDADVRTNMNVARAMVRLGRWCDSKGAKLVRYLIVPRECNGKVTKGADDYFAVGGTLEALIAIATVTEPDTETADDTFSDSRLAETIADEVLRDCFVWCKALGWLGWTGHRWALVIEEHVGEAIRRFVLRRFAESLETGKRSAVRGWYSMLTAARHRAVLSLAKGIVERTAEAFDAEPDLLNTPAGVVDLRTGQVWPHDPDLLLTKIASGNYRPGYTHSDWDQVLTALPEEVQEWFQKRVGQAITGHPTPDGVIPVCQGGGENGKSAVLTDGIVPALGDYAAPVSPKLVAGAKDEHSTERADLRGQRFLIAEEMTDDRALNVIAIKQITDVSRIKARYVYKDNITFVASHSLFVTTNYIPIVNETDHGTWRRLALVVFPYTYRKPGESLVGPMDRAGDGGLKVRLGSSVSGQHDAIVTWAVEGARLWYRFGFPALPAKVEADTRAWRKQADRISWILGGMPYRGRGLLHPHDGCAHGVQHVDEAERTPRVEQRALSQPFQESRRNRTSPRRGTAPAQAQSEHLEATRRYGAARRSALYLGRCPTSSARRSDRRRGVNVSSVSADCGHSCDAQKPVRCVWSTANVGQFSREWQTPQENNQRAAAPRRATDEVGMRYKENVEPGSSACPRYSPFGVFSRILCESSTAFRHRSAGAVSIGSNVYVTVSGTPHSDPART